MVHDRALFDSLFMALEAAATPPRRGRMFGCPACYVGRRLAFCVYQDVVAAKVPEAEAERLIASGMAMPFRPFGRPPMKEWIQLQPGADGIALLLPVLRMALRHAEEPV